VAKRCNITLVNAVIVWVLSAIVFSLRILSWILSSIFY